MSVIFVLIACSLFLATGFLMAYLWASKAGQFEDDYTPSIRILFEDDLKSAGDGDIKNQSQNHSMTKND